MAQKLLTTRTKKELYRKGEDAIHDAYDALVELNKLIEYYKTEIKINTVEMKRAKSKGEDAYYSYCEGRQEAYCDHLAEITYIAQMITGMHHDTEKQTTKFSKEVAEREVTV